MVLMAVVWLVVMAYGIYNTTTVQNLYPVSSLRYDTPITAQAGDAARRYAANEPSGTAFWPTYWSQSEETLQAELAQAAATCLWYSGDGNLVWPARFISGGYAGELSQDGISISTQLAWQLWGDTDIQGAAVLVGGVNYTVSGVFENKTALALVSCGSTTPQAGWQAVELFGSVDSERTLIENYALASGLGVPSSIVDNGIVGGMAVLLIVVPALPLFLYAMFRLFRMIWKKAAGKRGLVFFILTLGLAFCLPWLLSLLPDSFVPGRWSDFAYWGRFFEQQANRVLKWLSVRPMLIDVEAKVLLMKQGIACITGLAAAVWMVSGRNWCVQGKPKFLCA